MHGPVTCGKLGAWLAANSSLRLTMSRPDSIRMSLARGESLIERHWPRHTMMHWKIHGVHQLLGVLPDLRGVRAEGEPETDKVRLGSKV